MPTQWHMVSIDDCFESTGGKAEGLTAEQASQRLIRDGPNVLQSEEPPSSLRRFARQFNNVLLYVLLGAATVTGFLQQWLDTAVILAVVLINALVGYVQEGRAEEAIRAIRSMLKTRVRALRDGLTFEIDAEALVCGDVVTLQAGDLVPADVRVVASRRFDVDQSILTGESLPTAKDTATLQREVDVADRTNMAYAGTVVTRAWAQGLVVATKLPLQKLFDRLQIFIANADYLHSTILV